MLQSIAGVFYYAAGCDNGEIESADVIAMIENSKLHCEGYDFGEEKYCFHWFIKCDIDMVIICHPDV